MVKHRAEKEGEEAEKDGEKEEEDEASATPQTGRVWWRRVCQSNENILAIAIQILGVLYKSDSCGNHSQIDKVNG